jgi:hypothetical protein
MHYTVLASTLVGIFQNRQLSNSSSSTWWGVDGVVNSVFLNAHDAHRMILIYLSLLRLVLLCCSSSIATCSNSCPSSNSPAQISITCFFLVLPRPRLGYRYLSVIYDFPRFEGSTLVVFRDKGSHNARRQFEKGCTGGGRAPFHQWWTAVVRWMYSRLCTTTMVAY